MATRPAPKEAVKHLSRLRKRTYHLLELRAAGPWAAEENRWLCYGLWACRQDYADLGLLAEWRAVLAAEETVYPDEGVS